MMKTKYYYLKERYNPQFDKPYYSRLGNISVTEAKQYEKSLYGDNYVLKFDTEIEYLAKIEELVSKGYTVL